MQIEIDRLCIDQSSKKVKIGNSIIPLTKMEYEILFMLASNPLNTYSRRQILNVVWKDSAECVTEQAVNAHIIRLRKKLGEKAHCIVNRAGFGYEFDPEGE